MWRPSLVRFLHTTPIPRNPRTSFLPSRKFSLPDNFIIPPSFLRLLQTSSDAPLSSATPRSQPLPPSSHLLNLQSTSRFHIDPLSPLPFWDQQSASHNPPHIPHCHSSSRRRPLASRPPHPRYLYTSRFHSAIEKPRTIRGRYFSTLPPKTPSNGKTPTSQTVTWRQALTSPRKAATYASQLRRSLVGWCKHMWAGAKLLAADVSGSSKILKKITHGKQITRRERNFIVQTGVDLARLVPFSLFLIIPAAEFALPFALRLFPNMLPSQFQDQMKNEENLKRRLKGRLELAKYLSDVVEEKAKTIKASDATSELKKNAEDLTDFLNSIRSGKKIDPSEVGRFAKFFSDELTIDGAVRPQLIAMCKYMAISHYGHDTFLRFKLRSRLNAIKKDDMEIMWEGGVNSLTDDEVAKACRDRGIREEQSTQLMRNQLRDWLDLSQKKEIPSSLLIMSRAFLYFSADRTAEEGSDGLVEALEALPDDVIMDVKQAADVGDGNNVERLEETLRQAKLIEIESERDARKEKEDKKKRKKKEAEEEAERAGAEVATGSHGGAVPDDSILDEQVLRKVEKHEARVVEDVMVGAENSFADKQESAVENSTSSEQLASEHESKDEEELEKERDGIRNMLLSLEELSSDSAVESEREELRNLKLELGEAEAFVKGTKGEESSEIRRFKSLVSKLEKEIERVDAKVGLRMKLLDKDNDGLMSLDECKNVMTVLAGERDDIVVTETLKRLDANADGNISKADFARVLNEMQFELGVSEEPSQKKSSSPNPDV